MPTNGKIRILILEDNQSDVELVKRELRVSGLDFEADWASDRETFLQALDGATPDLILADYSLPGFDGMTALALARLRNAEAPVIIVSGAIGEETAIEALKAGATDYVLKQRLSRLVPVVQRAILEAEQRAERRRAVEALRKAKDELEERVTERTMQLRRLALELTQAEQRERKRLAGVLHDHLQQLLVGAKLGTELISRRAKDPQLKQSVVRVSALLNESINVSRSLAVELSPPILYESGLVGAVNWLGRWMNEHHNLTIEVHASTELAPDREGLSVLLFESIRELLLNVVKHAGVNSARVTIAAQGDKQVEITVSDQGTGFDPACAANVSATGFGLFSIRERLSLVGGRSIIDSAPGKGTRVTLIAPLPKVEKAEPAKAQPAPSTLARPAGKRSSTIRVLVADDHPITRQGIARLLEEEPDIEIVGEACDGREAVEMACLLHPDVVVMDVSMPRLSGVEATRQIKSTLPDVRVIGLSMYEEAEWAKAMCEAGALAYLHKSRQSGDLVTAIRAARPTAAEKTNM